MRAVLFALVAVGTVGASVSRAADEKELIVGTWEIVYSDAPDAITVGMKLTFTADGKLNLARKDKDGKEITKAVGTYKIEKGTLIVSEKDGDKPDTGRICLLNKTALVLHDEVEDKVMVLKRPKAK
jgi:uncharacterized protein (TIGR03066 family)